MGKEGNKEMLSFTRVLETLKNNERVFIDLLLLVILFVPMVYPLRLPFTISQQTKILYNAVETLPPGSIVWLHWDMGEADIQEAAGFANSILRQLFSRPIRFIMSCWNLPGEHMFDITMQRIGGPPPNKKYGVDWVEMGYMGVSVFSVGASALASNLHLKGFDRYQTPLSNLPLMNDANTVKDLAMLIGITHTWTEGAAYVTQWVAVYHTPCYYWISGIAQSAAAAYTPYYILSLLSGLRSSGEYEMITGHPGISVGLLDAMSAGSVYCLILVAIGNVILLREKYFKKKGVI